MGIKQRVRQEFASFGRNRVPIDQLSAETQQISRQVMSGQSGDPSAALQNYFASVACTPEVIAQQRAALNS